jgi:Large ribosomal RNA subunit accumulation protein YceD
MNRTPDMTDKADPWSVPVTVAQIPDTGLHRDIEAGRAVREVMAEVAGLREILLASASLDVTPKSAGRFHVAGRVRARIGQSCVVTLDPIENEIEEMVDLIFVPGVAPAADDAAPEPLLDDTVDLGALATEFLILGIDPYPRKPEAVFQAPPIEDQTEHPFAALAKLRRGQGGREE